jgi:hypothetical protein
MNKKAMNNPNAVPGASELSKQQGNRAVASSRLTEATSKVGSNTRSQTAIAIPTALLDHGSVTATDRSPSQQA